jgi:hypothetical protein
MFTNQKKYNADVFNACSGKGYSAPDNFSIMRGHSGKKIEAVYDNLKKF